VRAREILGRHRILRWAVPVVVLVAGGALGLTMLAPASADSPLPALTPDQLLSAVSTAAVAGLSGTVTENASLGLPALGSSEDDSMLGLLSGSHSLRVWYAGDDQQRVAMLNKAGEVDYFHNGAAVWQWDSAEQTATRLSAASAVDPQRLIAQVIATAGAASTVSLGAQQKVAGREAYQLVLTPKSDGTRISAVTIAVDGETHIPLSVHVSGPDGAVALDVSYLDVDFHVPNSAVFAFTPPQSAKVSTAAPAAGVLGAVKKIGTGWTAVYEVPDAAKLLPEAAFLPAVSGAWGSGHLYDSSLLSALLTSDGHLYLGPVDPSVLYAAVGK
jgi:outer membrane lipoprotein-sorting protein